MNALCSVLSVLCATGAAAAASLDGEWRFTKDSDGNLDASAEEFDDSAWQTVRVPHDWAISGPFNPDEIGSAGKLPWRGVGWYRRSVVLPADCAGESVYLDFDGVMASPKVYVNGQLAGGWDYGYMSFRVDATPFFRFGKANIIAVRADTRDHHSRWYPGAGIYRSVSLAHCPAVQIAHGETFITTPKATASGAVVHLEAAVTNRSTATAQCEMKAVVAGQAYAFPAFTVAANGTLRLKHDFAVASPKLWDVDAPNLYTAMVSVAANGKTDTETTRFGIRTIEFPPDDGFHLNGRRVQLHGVCLHADLGPLGMAFNRSAMRRQLAVMKDMGVNALRTSHNSCDPQVLDLCDEMGIVVWNECFDKWDGTSGRRADQNLEEYVSRNLKAFARRDRNHPSVIIWSVCNEIWPANPKNPNDTGMTRARFAAFRNAIREYDTTRPVGSGNCHQNAVGMGIFDDLDITGWNYGRQYAGMKRKYPDKPTLYSESASALSSYGYYEFPPANGKTVYAIQDFEVGSYDRNAASWSDIADVEFDRMEKDSYACGEFVWTGIDYLGEPTPYTTWKDIPISKMARSSYFGIVDLMGIPKDRFYLYRAYWNKKDTTVHILPHWNWVGREGKNVPVYVYTSGDSAELFLNGKSLGLREKGKQHTAFENLAAGKTASASSWENQDGKSNPAAAALDGLGETRWCASGENANEWWQVDLGKAVAFKYVGLAFEHEAKNYAYEVQLSDNGNEWKTVFSKKLGENGSSVEGAMVARFVRVAFTGLDKGTWASIRDVLVSTKAVPAWQLNSYYNVCEKYRLMWNDVGYEPGELKAVAYQNGKKIGEQVMRTAGKAAAVRLTPEANALPTDGDSVVFVQVDVVDAAGVRDPLATDRISFKLDGSGEIVAVGNGNPRGYDVFTKTDSHPLYFGKAVVVLRRNKGEAGSVTLTASAGGLKTAKATF